MVMLAISEEKLRARSVRVFKQQFLIFLEIHVVEKEYKNMCNIV